MAERKLSVRRTRDGTVTVKSGGYVETFDSREMLSEDLIDRVRWTVITSGVSLERETIRHLLAEERLIP